MKNVKKVLRNVSEADFERFCLIPKYGDVRENKPLEAKYYRFLKKSKLDFL